MPVKHLLKQVEIYRSKRNNRDVRPPWVTELIDRVADLFEPTTGVGRVGFECQLAEDCWVVGMYLGSTEIIGGPDDGQTQQSNFHFDLLELIDCFNNIERVRWSAFPEGTDDASTACSLITIEGCVGENSLRLKVYANPPADAGPGFRKYADGRRDTV